MKTWQITGLACLMAVNLAACAHSGDTQVLQYVGALQPLRAGDRCLETDRTRVVVHGTLDLAMSKSYRFFPGLQSMMQSTNTIININPSIKDTNTINLTSMSVSVVSGLPGTAFATTPTAKASGAPNKLATTWTVPVSGTLIAGSFLQTEADLVPEQAQVGNTLVPIGTDWRAHFYSAAKAKQDFSKVDVVLSFQFLGTTLSGDNVITDPATLALTVCYGCLLQPAQAATPGNAFFTGCTAAVPADILALVPCVLGQDDPIDCRFYCQECQRSSTPAYEGCLAAFCPQ